MKVYYAHCMAIYGKPQERADVKMLQSLGFTVFNPNNADVSKRCKKLRSQGINPMAIFEDYVKRCDVFAYHPLPDGRIPSGVALEYEWAQEMNMPIIELPADNMFAQRRMSYEDTVKYLRG